jgi:hypothetical protein
MNFYYLLLLIVFAACTTRQPAVTDDGTDQPAQTDNAVQKHKHLLYAKQDTVTIIAESGYDTIQFSKKDFNLVVDNFPELYEDIPSHPDIVYAKSSASRSISDNNGDNKYITFGSELGQDYFFMLYAYFYPPKNNDAEALRKKLIEGYTIINSIFNSLHGFGTFFVHQYRRIPAYAAYWTHNYTEENNRYFLQDFREEKNHFLEMLKLEITNNIKNNNDILGASLKKQKTGELFTQAARLDSLITSQYILHRICEFRYSYYQ